MSALAELPRVRGRLTEQAPLAPLVWFKAGGNAQWLFEPTDVEDLSDFLAGLDPDVPVMGLGLGSNLIVRDGGVPGVVVRLGKPFTQANLERALRAAMDAAAAGSAEGKSTALVEPEEAGL